MDKKQAVVLIFLVFMGLIVVFGPRQAVSALPVQGHKVFLPIVSNTEESRFWIEIAAIHQIGPGSMLAEPKMSEAELKSLIEEAFPTLIQSLVESGAGGTRLDVKWSDIEPNPPIDGQPTYDWDWYDERLRQIGEARLKMILTITDPPIWAAAWERAPIYPDRYDEFARFVTDLVNRYKGSPYNVSYWEVLNEPDTAYGWGNAGADYANLLSYAYTAIKTADPGAIVLQGGIAYDWFIIEAPDGRFVRSFPDQVMGAGGGSYIDVLNFHYFEDFHAEWERWDPNHPDRQSGILPAPTCGDVFDDSEGDPWGNLQYEAGGIDLVAKGSHYRNRMSTCYGINKPVWLTESGEHGRPGDDASLAEQANYVIKVNVRALSVGIRKIVWYALTTPNDDTEMQLLYSDWTPKPAFYSYQTLTRELRGYIYDRTLNATGVEAYAFRSGQKEKVVAWGSGVITFTSASQLRVVDRNGNVTWIQDGSGEDLDGVVNNSITYQVPIEPVFLQK